MLSPNKEPDDIFFAFEAFEAPSTIFSIWLKRAFLEYPKLSKTPAFAKDSITLLLTLLASILDTKSDKLAKFPSSLAFNIEFIATSPAPLIAPIPNITTSLLSTTLAANTKSDLFISGGNSSSPNLFTSSTYLTTLSVLSFSSVKSAAINSAV